MTACGDDGGGEANPDNGVAQAMGAVMLSDANNYTSVSILDLPVIDTIPGDDVEICWDGLTQDLQCHGVAPQTDVDLITLLRFPAQAQAEVANALAIGRVELSQLVYMADYEPPEGSAMCTQLSALTRFGSPLTLAEDYSESGDIYVVVFQKGTDPGVGALAMSFVNPTALSGNTRVDAPMTACPNLSFSANIQQVVPITLPAAAPWQVDWSGVTRDSTMEGLQFTKIDSVLVGFYANMTVADIEANILDIELIATELYEVPHDYAVNKNVADLSLATERTTGAPFPGLARADGLTGTWMMAVMCSSCQNPAPAILTILQPGG